MDFAVLVLGVILLQETVARGTVFEPAGRPYRGIVATGAVFAKGCVKDGDVLAVSGLGRTERIQWRARSRFADGSVRATSLWFPAVLAPLGAHSIALTRLPEMKATAEPAEEWIIDEDTDAIEVTLGDWSVCVGSDVAHPIERWSRQGRDILRPAEVERRTAASPGEIRVEERGPWRVVVRQF